MTKNILLCEDEVSTQKILCAVLEKLEYKIKIVANGKECLKVLEKGDFVPSLLLLDLNMPLMGGLEVLEHLKSTQRLGEFPILVLSAHNDYASIEQAIQKGASDYLLKPMNISLLLNRITSLLFEIDEHDIYQALKGLSVPDPTLCRAPSLRPWMTTESIAFQNNIRGTSVCVVVYENEHLKSLKNMKLEQLEIRIVILRKGETGWKPVWPPQAVLKSKEGN